MTPAFGFSVGDLMSAIGLIKKVNKALKNVGGASVEYQSVVIELNALENVLQHLRALEPTEDNLHHINAIRCMALACQLPLQEFLVSIERYESSLGPWSEQTALRSASHKVKWTLSITEQVEKFRALVAAKTISINMLLATHCSQTLSTINARTTQEQEGLRSKIAEHRTKLDQVQASIENLEGNISQKTAAVYERLDTISEKANATQLSILSVRHLGEQITAYIRTFPKEVRDLLKTIITSNAQMYQTLMQIQYSISRTTSSRQASNLRFTNVLGEYRELPYEYFCHWESFEGFLKAQFKGKPGETKVLDGLYHIINITDNTSSVIKREYWNRSISEGARLDMSMIMSAIQRKSASCPRPGCKGSVVDACGASNVCVCNLCHLKFFLTSDKIEDVSGRISLLEEDDNIKQKQVKDDIQTFGSRPEPIEFTEIQDNCLSKLQLPFKGSVTALKEHISIPTEVRKEEESMQTYSVTAMDWNSGASYLDAWLNQSAIPAAAPAINEQQEERKDTLNALNSSTGAQEIEEIKVFRNVHISSASEPVIDGRYQESVDELANSELDTQIYYRNIVDRYPELPSYLALRLARANRGRAERLRQSKANRDSLNRSHLDQQKLSGTPIRLPQPQPPMTRSFDETNKRTEKKHKCKICDKRFTRPSSLQTHMYSHTGEKPCTCEFEGCAAPPPLPPPRYLDDLSAGRDPGWEWGNNPSGVFGRAGRTPIAGSNFSVVSELRRHRKTHKANARHEPAPPPLPPPRYLLDDLSAGRDPGWEWGNSPSGVFGRAGRTPIAGSNFSVVSDLRRHRKTHKANARSPRSANTRNSDRSAYPPDLEDTDTGNLDSRKNNPDRKSPHSETDYYAAFLKSGSAAIEMNSGAECESTMLEQSRLHTDWEQPELYTTGSDFWTGRITRSRRDSVDSLSSSMNSSLHGKATFDPQEQEPAFRDSHSHSSVDFGDSSRGLPPPPVEIGKKHSFECDICGNTIRVDRRLEWQEHVLQDLQPYTCTVKDCGVADRVYASRAAFSLHEMVEHPLMADLDPRCPLCSEDIGLDRTNRARHIGRHMEEIAFAIVTKPYEEWDFYSGPSEKHLDGPSLGTAASWYSEPTWYPCICHACDITLHTVAERAKHFVSMHGFSVAAARAQLGGGFQCHRSSNLERRPCNIVCSSRVDLKTHVFTTHTVGRMLFCAKCKQGNLLLANSSHRQPRTADPMLAVEPVKCGLCGDLALCDELLRTNSRRRIKQLTSLAGHSADYH